MYRMSCLKRLKGAAQPVSPHSLIKLFNLRYRNLCSAYMYNFRNSGCADHFAFLSEHTLHVLLTLLMYVHYIRFLNRHVFRQYDECGDCNSRVYRQQRIINIKLQKTRNKIARLQGPNCQLYCPFHRFGNLFQINLAENCLKQMIFSCPKHDETRLSNSSLHPFILNQP